MGGLYYKRGLLGPYMRSRWVGIPWYSGRCKKSGSGSEQIWLVEREEKERIQWLAELTVVGEDLFQLVNLTGQVVG